MKPLMLDEDSEEAQPPVQIPVQSETPDDDEMDDESMLDQNDNFSKKISRRKRTMKELIQKSQNGTYL